MRILSFALCGVASLAAAALISAGAVQAATVIGTVVLPNAISYEYFGLNTASNEVTSDTIGTLNYNGGPGCAGTCTATTALGADPSASVTVNEKTFEGDSGGFAEVALGYYVEYLNAPGTYNVTLGASDKLYASDGSRVTAYLRFGQAGASTLNLDNFASSFFEEADCLNGCPVGYPVSTVPFGPTATVSIVANVPYYIQLGAILGATPTLVQIGGSVDPTFTDNGAGGTFAFSPGVFQAATGGVPEAATWAMMVIGFGVTGAAMRRRRRTSVSYA